MLITFFKKSCVYKINVYFCGVNIKFVLCYSNQTTTFIRYPTYRKWAITVMPKTYVAGAANQTRLKIGNVMACTIQVLGYLCALLAKNVVKSFATIFGMPMTCMPSMVFLINLKCNCYGRK